MVRRPSELALELLLSRLAGVVTEMSVGAVPGVVVLLALINELDGQREDDAALAALDDRAGDCLGQSHVPTCSSRSPGTRPASSSRGDAMRRRTMVLLV